ncbi:sugar transferase [Microbacterium betulae]|uniref:sugar transferase n=1 Tax=Microbacterium betulae TaxID=2981139 RepID=UPI002938EE3E|nr:sugar transferase [Microbacterium sp. AB]
MTTEITRRGQRGADAESAAAATASALTGGTTFPAVLRTASGKVPVVGSTPPPRFDWRRRFARRLLLTDFVVIAAVVFGTQLGWLGVHTPLATAMPIPAWPVLTSYTVLSVVVVLLWTMALALNDTRSDRVIGAGAAEYKRILDASFMLFGIIAIAAFLLKIEIARGYLLIALPTGVLALFLERWLWRRWLARRRATGEYSARVLLVGSERSVAHLGRELKRTKGTGYSVVGACIPTGRVTSDLGGTDIPVLGSVNSVERAIEVTGADTVVITSTDELGPQRVKQVSWALEAGKQHLVLAPSITDIAGPRIHMRPVAGLPLMHVETPRFSPAQRFVKRMMDLFGSLLIVTLLSPLLLVLAAVVKLTSPGPVIYRQTRIGRHGREFGMLKFRSMVVGADKLLEDLIDQQDLGNEVQFKMRDDPRVTRVGRVMRKFSLDELPQLFNVLGGSMSLVGPRPPIQREVEQYDAHVYRRFLVKPGITGLWQVSGRSTLSWDDSVRLDLSYVENWSVMNDLVILLKTGKAALLPGDTAS